VLLFEGRIERSLDLKSMGPAPIVAIPREAAEIARRLEARRVGEALLREGKAGVLIVAGGQGSRLGFNGPKGMFPVSPVRGKTLFRLFCESLKAASLLYGARIPLVIMTSRENDSDTRTYFESNGYFDLDRQDVHFFEQGMAPTITPGGALIVKDETHLFTNPDGHGGSLKGLHDSGLLDHLISRGVSDIFYCQVDNPLAKIADPANLDVAVIPGIHVIISFAPGVRRIDLVVVNPGHAELCGKHFTESLPQFL